MAKDIIKINVNVTLEVSKADWDLAYGTGTDSNVVKENVRDHILGILQALTTGDQGAGDGAIKTATPRWS
jgi:hypothetical protein